MHQEYSFHVLFAAKSRGRPPKKDKGKLKIKKLKIPPPQDPGPTSPEWPKVTIPKLTPDDVKR